MDEEVGGTELDSCRGGLARRGEGVYWVHVDMEQEN